MKRKQNTDGTFTCACGDRFLPYHLGNPSEGIVITEQCGDCMEAEAYELDPPLDVCLAADRDAFFSVPS